MSKGRRDSHQRKKRATRKKTSSSRNKKAFRFESKPLPTLQDELARSLASRFTPEKTTEEPSAPEIEPTRS